MRVLVGIGFAAEGDEEFYTATPLTIQMTRPEDQACIRHQSVSINPRIAPIYASSANR